MPNAQLTRAWWSANKAKTLKSTHLGDALGKWEADEAAFAQACSKLGRDLDARFKAAESAIRTLPAAVKTARDACNPTLHKQTIAYLDEFRTKLIPKAANNLVNRYDKARAEIEAKHRELLTAQANAQRVIIGFEKTFDQVHVTLGKQVTKMASLAKQAIAHSTAMNHSMAGRVQHDAEELSVAMLNAINTTRGAFPRVETDFNNTLQYRRAAAFLPVGHKILKDYDKLTMIRDKIKSGMESWDRLWKAAEASRKIVDDAVRGGINTRDTYVKIVLDDAKRFANAAGPVGRAESNVGSALSAAGEKLGKLGGMQGAQAEQLKGEIRGALASASDQLKHLIEVLGKLEKDVRKSTGNYPPFVTAKDPDFKVALQDIGRVQSFIEEMRKAASEGAAKLKRHTESLQKAGGK